MLPETPAAEGTEETPAEDGEKTEEPAQAPTEGDGGETEGGETTEEPAAATEEQTAE